MDGITAAGIGHNSPPEPIAFDALKTEADERIDVANRWITERPEITAEDQAEKATGFRDQLKGSIDALEAARRAEKKPLEDQLKAIDDRYRPLTTLLTTAHTTIKGKISAWLEKKRVEAERLKAEERERARKAQQDAEEAARKAAEEATKAGGDPLRAQREAEEKAKAAAAAAKTAEKPVERQRISGAYTGRATGQRETWKARIAGATDEERAANATKALKHYAKDPTVRAAALEAALRLANADAKVRKSADMAPPGLEYFREYT